MVKVIEVTCDHRINPVGVPQNIVFSWKIDSEMNNTFQTSYRIQLSFNKQFSVIEYDSGVVESKQSVNVVCEDLRLDWESKYYYRVRITDNYGRESKWSDVFSLETNLNPEKWEEAYFITGETVENKDRSNAYVLRKKFTTKTKLKRAILYSTAKGVYSLYINGKRIEQSYLMPGWTEYEKHLLYQINDVTRYLKDGENIIGSMVGAGWYKGTISFAVNRNNYGEYTSWIGILKLTYDNGEVEYIKTDSSWEWKEGPITYSEIYNGETYDNRKRIRDWAEDSDLWSPVNCEKIKSIKLEPQCSMGISCYKTISAKEVIYTSNGECVIDFGQNLSGFVKIRVQGKSGDIVQIRHAEVLDKNGNFYTENLKEAKQQITYILSGEGVEEYVPSFTYQGFRYICIDKFPGEIMSDSFEAFAISTDLKKIGSFNSSHTLLNRLFKNIVWSLRSNFVDIPTDCPQRSERLGWTGDAQIFSETALYLTDCYNFYRKWLVDLQYAQNDEGGVPHIVPDALTREFESLGNTVIKSSYGASGWGDAATICPWNLYLFTGDTNILEQQYESMKCWLIYIKNHSEKGVFWNKGFHFGDWVALDSTDGFFGATPVEYTAMIYHIRSLKILLKTAKLIREEDIETWNQQLKLVEEEYKRRYFDEYGNLTIRTQTACVLCLKEKLYPQGSKDKVVKMLLELLEENNGHLVTGFLGTPYICEVLSDNGCEKEAYDLLLKEDYPSWLYQVKKGATTIWEHWDGIKANGDFWDPDMNSFNHYSYGSVGAWIFKAIGGLHISEELPGFEQFKISPIFGNKLDYAEVVYNSPYGEILCSWKRTKKIITLLIMVPTNTKAFIELHDIKEVLKTDLRKYELVKNKFTSEIGSGEYKFVFSICD